MAEVRLFSAVLLLAASGVVHAGTIQTFINDYDGFLAAAGSVQTLDFETLPDGTPTVGGTLITPEFNYTAEGVTFSSPIPRLVMAGNPDLGFGLRAMAFSGDLHTWIDAAFVVPVSAAGVFFPGNTEFTLFENAGGLLGMFDAPSGGIPYSFFGVISDVPIARLIGDRGTSGESWEAMVFQPIPEPGPLTLVSLGTASTLAMRRLARRPRR